VASNAKIDQIHVVIGCAHDIQRLDIAEDNWWLVVMEVVKHSTELDTNFQHHLNWEALDDFVLVVFQCIACDKVHYDVGATMLGKVVVNARQVGMYEIRKQKRFTLKGCGSLGQFLGTEAILVHFFDRYEAMAEKRIFRLVDSPKATGTYLADDTIT
jgi:hypothetical protein